MEWGLLSTTEAQSHRELLFFRILCVSVVNWLAVLSLLASAIVFGSIGQENLFLESIS
jgi:hypothetical protein